MNIDIQDVIAAARAGGAVVKRYFGEALQADEKTSASDLRTKADTESEQAIIAALQRAFPDCNIYAEESGQIDNGSEYTFVIDPLDGTSNFVLGIPDFAISVGLLKGDESILGVIYNPILDRLYSAEKGRGAYLNGQPIHVNTEADSSRATVSYTCGYHTSREYSDGVRGKLLDLPIKRTLETWAPAYDYCLLASGRLEAVISKEGDLEDYVAAKVIVTEAGGKVTSFAGEPVDGKAPDFIATNGTAMHEKLLQLLS
ncbi:MAG TPA: inositol monophosphatase [Candidatus Saccharimonadales bacterium]|nr:inositol monophosphatase [Candidatus Saccharimonadales bacterium]